MTSIRSIMDKIKLVKDPNTSPEVLEELADDKDWHVRRLVTTNPNCPIKLLGKLADDEDWGVRWNIADNPNCPIKLLEKLANDKDRWVRKHVAKNHNCPEYIKTYFEARKYMEKYYAQV